MTASSCDNIPGTVNSPYTIIAPDAVSKASLDVLVEHMHISETLLDLHKHGDAIQNALLVYKGKKNLKADPNKAIYKVVFESCNYSCGSLMNDLMTLLDGLIFAHVPELNDDHFTINSTDTPIYLTSIYYSRSKWMKSYAVPHQKLIFDTCEYMTESDIAYILNYMLIYLNRLGEIDTFVQDHNDDIYDSKEKARKVILKLTKVMHSGFHLLQSMLVDCIKHDAIVTM